MPTWKSEQQKMWQTITARATAGEQNSKWWLTPTNKYHERSEYLKGVLGGRCNHDWGMTERGEQNKLTRHDEHLPERRSECGSGSHKGSRKNTSWSVARSGDFFQAACFTLGAMFFWVQEFRQRLSIASASWALHSPCTKFVNKVAEWRRPLYLFGLNLRGLVFQINYTA